MPGAPSFIVGIHTTEASVGENARIEGRVEGADRVNWSRDGEELVSGIFAPSGAQKYVFEYRAEDGYCALVVVEVEEHDQGTYVAEASNAAGAARSEAFLSLPGTLLVFNLK